MNDMISISFSGMDETQKAFEKLVKKFPDKAGKLLRKNATTLRKEVAEKYDNETKVKGTRKYSIAANNGYVVSQVKGIYTHQYVEIRCRAKHFHLVEHGHRIVDKKGRANGFVEGKHIMDTTTRKYEMLAPVTFEHMMNELLKMEGML